MVTPNDTLMIRLDFTHYGPKDNESGVKEYLIGIRDNIIKYIDNHYLYGYLAEEPDEKLSVAEFAEEWWTANPVKELMLSLYGLKKDSYSSVVGQSRDITRWYRGTDWQDPVDCYYGVTHYSWKKEYWLTEQEADRLVELGIARRV